MGTGEGEDVKRPMWLVGVLLLALSLLACSSKVRTVAAEDADDDTQDVGGVVTIEVAPGGLSGGVAGGTVESTNFSARFTLSVPMDTPAAESDDFVVQPGIELAGPDREGGETE